MEEWGTYKLSEISSFKTGKLDSNASCEGGKYPFFTCSPETLSINQYAFDQKAILLAGNNAEGNFNVKYYEGKFNAYQRTYVFTANEKKVIPYFLFYALKICLNDFKQMSQGTSTKFLTAKILNSFEVKLPPISIQAKIVNLLRSIDEKVALNNRINHNLEEQAQALYKSWFVDFEPFKDGKFIDSELGMIPEGWRIGTLSDLGAIVAGGTPYKAKPEYYMNNGIAWLTPKDLSVKCNKFTARGETDISEEGYKNSSAKLMPRGSVLFSSRAPIGYISIAKGDICTNQGFKSVVPTYAGTAYVYYWLCENTVAIESQASGSTFKEASSSLMKSFPAIVPEKSVLDSFEKELAPILAEQENLEEEIYQAEQIRDYLLPRLMSGELIFNG